MNFDSIKAIKIYQPMTARCLVAFPIIYKCCMDELTKYSKCNSYKKMWSDTYNADTIFHCQIFDFIRKRLENTGTFLEIIDGELSLNINKFMFKDDSDRTMTLYKLQWDKKSYETLRDVKIPEFIEILESNLTHYTYLKEYFHDCELVETSSLSTIDEEEHLHAIANRKRINGLFTIIEKISYFYKEILSSFTNSITEQYFYNDSIEEQVEKESIEEGQEAFYTRYDNIKDIVKNVKKVSKEDFIKEALAGDLMVAYPKRELLLPKNLLVNKLNGLLQGSSFSSIKMISDTNSDGVRMAIGYGIIMNQATFSKVKLEDFLNNTNGVILLRHKTINDDQRDKLVDMADDFSRRNPSYNIKQLITSSLAHYSSLYRKYSGNGTKKIKDSLICSTILEILYEKVKLNTGIKDYNNLEVWPRDFLLSNKFDRVCGYFNEGELDNIK